MLLRNLISLLRREPNDVLVPPHPLTFLLGNTTFEACDNVEHDIDHHWLLEEEGDLQDDIDENDFMDCEAMGTAKSSESAKRRRVEEGEEVSSSKFN